MTSILSCVSLSMTLETKLESLIESFWSSKSFISSARRRRSLVSYAELLALDRERTDVVHDLAPEVVLALSGMSIFSSIERISRSSGLLVATGVLVLDLLLEGVGANVVDVVGAQPRDRAFVGADRSLHLVLDDLFVLLFTTPMSSR